ncbi:MAG: transmembrane anchor protein [Burkholderiaceae bacterium]|nr:transmembrane anchor protein [Burkholderiaceae bacterium]
MYNAQLPSRAELPSSGQLLRSTIIAIVSAAVILVTIVLPSEYAIDPTGIGAKLGLTQMGEIKMQLAAEAEADAKAQAVEATLSTAPTTPTSTATPPSTTPVVPSSAGEPAAQAVAPTAAPVVAPTPPVAQAAATPAKPATPVGKSDEISFTLKPGQGAEIKLVMKAGAKVNYSWTANGAVVNYDTHGDGGGRSITYEKGRGVPSGEGILEAAFEGNHGWFWRNRTKSDVTVTLKTSGDYIELKRVI